MDILPPPPSPLDISRRCRLFNSKLASRVRVLRGLIERERDRERSVSCNTAPRAIDTRFRRVRGIERIARESATRCAVLLSESRRECKRLQRLGPGRREESEAALPPRRKSPAQRSHAELILACPLMRSPSKFAQLSSRAVPMRHPLVKGDKSPSPRPPVPPGEARFVYSRASTRATREEY